MESSKKFLVKVLFTMYRSPMREAIAEFLATLIFIVCGDGVMAAIVLGRAGHNSSIASAFGWGLSLMVAICISGGVSGGHVNPAVTVAMTVFKKCSIKKMFHYLVAQYLASFLAAGVVYMVYADAIRDFDNGLRQVPPEINSTAEIFSTFPQSFASIGSCFIDQVVGTALLLLVICACTDTRNIRMPTHIQPAAIGMGLSTICLAFGHNCGAPLNPARDLAPRFFTFLFGWGVKVFSFRNYTWFWVPVIGPHIGAILGVFLYEVFIAMPFKTFSELLDAEADTAVDKMLEDTTVSQLSDMSLEGSGEKKVWSTEVMVQTDKRPTEV